MAQLTEESATRVPDPDPVTAEYDVFITPELEQQLYLLQFPTRSRNFPYNDQIGNKPLEFRVKPKSRFAELDIPIPTTSNYNVEKANTWGEALNKAHSEAPNGFGISAGFAHNTSLRGGAQKPTKTDDMDVDDEDDRIRMKHHTLGGQILKADRGAPRYMIGTFKEDQLHLTMLDGVAQMRHQYAHIDAKTQMDRNKSRREREAVEGPRTVEPKQVQVTYKALDSEHLDINQTKDLLQAAQDEPWTRFRYNDEELPESYQMYHDKLFVEDTDSAIDLVSSMNNEQYLDAISASTTGRRKPKPAPKKGKAIPVSDEESSESG